MCGRFSAFRRIVEGRLTGSADAPVVGAMTWTASEPGAGGVRWERVECGDVAAGLCTSPGFQRLLRYDAATVQRWDIDVVAGSCQRFVEPRSSSDELSNSPLKQLGDGFLPAAMTNRAGARAYEGRSTNVRGVPADTFRSSWNTSSDDGVSYSFSAFEHFSPEGWAFPGRTAPAWQAQPMRVHTLGSWTDAAGRSGVSPAACARRGVTV